MADLVVMMAGDAGIVGSHGSPFSENEEEAAERRQQQQQQRRPSTLNRHLLEPGERPLLQREHIQCKFSGKNINRVINMGTIYLTSSRIIFVPKTGRKSAFWQNNQNLMSIRFSDIKREKFNQPLFGANNVAGLVSINSELGNSEMKWKFNFNNGGVGTFLMAFNQCMRATRRYHAQMSRSAEESNDGIATAEAVPFMIDANCVENIINAPRDARDPTCVWVENAILIADADDE